MAPSSFWECNTFSAFPAVNGSEIRNAGILRKVMVQLGTQAHKAVKTTARTSVKCYGEASKCRRAQRGRAFLSRVFTACQAPSWHTALRVLSVKSQMGLLRPEGGGTASKWRSQDASPDLASFDLTVYATRYTRCPGGWERRGTWKDCSGREQVRGPCCLRRVRRPPRAGERQGPGLEGP